MKKISTLVLALMSMFVISQSALALTYNVTVPAGTEACFIAGAMNGWSATAGRMTKVDATHFTITYDAATATDEYKYLSGPDWKYEEKTEAGTALPANRTWTASDVVAKWGALYLLSYAKDVTIDVLTPTTTVQCYLVGNFNGWASPSTATQMTKGATTGDGVEFYITVNVLDTTIMEYKVCAGPAWSYEQKTPSANFKYMTDGGVVIVTEFKAIFDPAKTGTINITATVPAGTDRVWIQGDFLGWDMGKAMEGTKNTNGTFSFSIPMVQSIEYKMYNLANWNNVEVDAAGVEVANRKAAYPADANLAITVIGWKTPLAVPTINMNNYKIYTNDHSLVVEGVTSQVDVIDISGRILQSVKMTGKFTSEKLNAGLYILRVDGATKKVSLK
ncbi:MAG TPA: T9SS type A sorting domain-containing protein [Paludibacter sp.]